MRLKNRITTKRAALFTGRVVAGQTDQDEYSLDAHTCLIGKAPASLVRLKGWFKPSVGEIIVGTGAGRRFAGLNIGDTPKFRGREWRIVGKFECAGQAYESEVWGDIDDIKAQFKREYSAVLIRCAEPGEVKRLCKLIEGDKQFHQMVVGRIGSRLDHEDVLAAYVFVNFDEHLHIRKAADARLGQR